MKNIVIFTSTLGAGGAEKQAALLAQLLTKQYKVHFVALYGDLEQSDYVLSILNKAKVNIYLLTGSQRAKFRAYAKILKDNNIVCAFNYLTKCDFWGAIIEKQCRVEKIYNGIRNSRLEIYKTILEFISHNLVADGTIFNSYSAQKYFCAKGFNKHKSIVIPNYFPAIHKPIERITQEPVRIIIVSRFVASKDYKTAIKTISLLKKERRHIIFDICGYGPLESQIRKWVKLYDIEDLVEYHIHPNNIPELLRKANIYLSTSIFEGTSNSIMEAMNWSLPVVATNVGDNNYLVRTGENGFLHNVGDACGLTQSLIKLIDSNDLRKSMGFRGNEILRKYYSTEIFIERYIKLIEG